MIRSIQASILLCVGVMLLGPRVRAYQPCDLSNDPNSIVNSSYGGADTKVSFSIDGKKIRLDSIEDTCRGVVYTTAASPIWQVVLRQRNGSCRDPLESPLIPFIDSRDCGSGNNCQLANCALCEAAEVRYPASFFGTNVDCNGSFRLPKEAVGYTKDLPEACNVSLNRVGDVLTLSWIGVNAPDCPTFDVYVHVTEDTRGFISWSIEVDLDEECDDWYIQTVKFPIIVSQKIGDTRKDDRFAFPMGYGIEIENPIANYNPHSEERIDHKDPNSPFMRASENEKFNYPAKVQSQFMAYYDPDATDDKGDPDNDATSSGLYLAADDPDGFLKRLYFCTPRINPGSLLMQFTHFVTASRWDRTKFAGDDHFQQFDLSNVYGGAGYTVILRAFEGDWYDAAQMYRKWIEDRQPGFAPDGLDSRLKKRLEGKMSTIKDSFEDALLPSLSIAYRPEQADANSLAAVPVDPNANAPNSDYTMLRSCSEFFSANECADNFWVEINRLNPKPGVRGTCNDIFIVPNLLTGAKDLIRKLRFSQLECQGIPALFRWVALHSDAGNYGEENVDCSCTNQDLTDFREKGLARTWDNRILRKNEDLCCPLKAPSWSGSEWLREEVRLPRWKLYMGMTNIPTPLPAPNPCPNNPMIDASTWDWKGANSIAVTGDGPTVRPSYTGLHFPLGMNTIGGGGTEWNLYYQTFIERLRSDLYGLSGGTKPDLAAMPIITERANEQVVPYAHFFGKYRDFPFDTTFRDPSGTWIASSGARSIPLLPTILHDYSVFVSEVRTRLSVVDKYKTIENLTCPVPVTHEGLMSFRIRMRYARAVLNGCIPSIPIHVDDTPLADGTKPIQYDGPPDPGFTCPASSSWVFSPVHADYEYLTKLVDVRAQFPEYLVYGEMLRIPRVVFTDECWTEHTKTFIQKEPDTNVCSTSEGKDVEKPIDIQEVYCTIWKNPHTASGDPDIGFIVTNFNFPTFAPPCKTTEDLSFKIHFRPADFGLDANTTYKFERVGYCGTETEDAGLGTFSGGDTDEKCTASYSMPRGSVEVWRVVEN